MYKGFTYNKADFLAAGYSLDENVSAGKSRTGSHDIFLIVETASILLYAQETTAALLRGQFCFSERLVIQYEDRIISKD